MAAFVFLTASGEFEMGESSRGPLLGLDGVGVESQGGRCVWVEKRMGSATPPPATLRRLRIYDNN
uniref:OSJNBa0034E24.7 protein n=2 Tax=Oryza TaxID=4527 RepID=Q7XK04_ORYSJ|nr:OSJNBa0034E24.7 [Oryza sativa Japonica Group]